MRALTLLAIAAVVALAGCTAKGGEDPFAYTKKPLYASGFDLGKMTDARSEEFRVQDGSIVRLRVLVWVNATEGGADVTLTDPSGRVVLATSETAERFVPMNLGAWMATVTPREGSAGSVHVLIVRA